MPNVFDPAENAERVRKGLLSLVANKAISFARDSEQSRMIVIFDVKPSPFVSSKILQFQQLFLSATGYAPVILDQVPACVKVFFDVPIETSEERQVILDILKNPEFLSACESLDISWLQFVGTAVLHRDTN